MIQKHLLFFLLTSGWSMPTEEFFWFSYDVEIFPKDSFVFIGETLKIKCKPKTDNIDISQIKLKGESAKGTWEIPIENVTLVNETMVAMVYIDELHTDMTTYACYIGSQGEQSTFVHAERHFRNIINFRGIYYYEKSIELSWELDETYIDPSFLSVTVKYNPNEPPNLGGNNCSVQTNTSCSISNYRSQDILFFRIKVSSERSNRRPSAEYLTPLFNTSAISVERFVPFDNLKTDVPTMFTVKDRNSTCLFVTWENPSYFRHCQCAFIYHIEVKPEGDSDFRIAVDSATKANLTQLIQVCSLNPFTIYTLRLTVKATEVNPWSDPALTEGRTAEDRPLTGPPLLNTSYYIEECEDNKRKVLVYWNNPTVETVQGVLTHYEIHVNKNITKSLQAGFTFFPLDLECNFSPQKIEIYSATIVGIGAEPSVLVIPNAAILLSEDNMDFKVEEMTSLLGDRTVKNISVTWNATSLERSSVTLLFYRCQESGISKTCLFNLTVTEVNSELEQLSLYNIPIGEDLFGFALRDKGHKQGIHWTDCVYRTDKVPEKLAGVLVGPGSEDNSLSVSWISSRCNRNSKVLILQYHLYLCTSPKLELKQCSHFVVRSSAAQKKYDYTVRDLKRGQKYYVFLQAESLVGLGPESDPVEGVPFLDSSLDAGTIVLIVLGVILVIICACLICFVVRKCCRGRKHYEELIKSCPEGIPHVGDDSRSQTSRESGIGSSRSAGQESSNEGDSNRAPVPPAFPDGLITAQPSQLSPPAPVAEDGDCDQGDEDHTDTDNYSRMMIEEMGYVPISNDRFQTAVAEPAEDGIDEGYSGSPNVIVDTVSFPATIKDSCMASPSVSTHAIFVGHCQTDPSFRSKGLVASLHVHALRRSGLHSDKNESHGCVREDTASRIPHTAAHALSECLVDGMPENSCPASSVASRSDDEHSVVSGYMRVSFNEGNIRETSLDDQEDTGGKHRSLETDTHQHSGRRNASHNTGHSDNSETQEKVEHSQTEDREAEFNDNTGPVLNPSLSLDFNRNSDYVTDMVNEAKSDYVPNSDQAYLTDVENTAFSGYVTNSDLPIAGQANDGNNEYVGIGFIQGDGLLVQNPIYCENKKGEGNSAKIINSRKPSLVDNQLTFASQANAAYSGYVPNSDQTHQADAVVGQSQTEDREAKSNDNTGPVLNPFNRNSDYVTGMVNEVKSDYVPNSDQAYLTDVGENTAFSGYVPNSDQAVENTANNERAVTSTTCSGYVGQSFITAVPNEDQLMRDSRPSQINLAHGATLEPDKNPPAGNCRDYVSLGFIKEDTSSTL